MKSIGKIQTGKKKGQAAQKCFSPTQQENNFYSNGVSILTGINTVHLLLIA